MRKALVLVVLLVAALAAKRFIGEGGADAFDALTGDVAPVAAPATRVAPGTAVTPTGEFRAGEIITGAGIVTRLLPDDDEGSAHQRFILRLPSGRTLLVAHNIDLAPRIDGLRVGDGVEFRGEYQPNAQGGVLHWTHHDPDRSHTAGWLRHRGRLYQ